MYQYVSICINQWLSMVSPCQPCISDVMSERTGYDRIKVLYIKDYHSVQRWTGEPTSFEDIQTWSSVRFVSSSHLPGAQARRIGCIQQVLQLTLPQDLRELFKVSREFLKKDRQLNCYFDVFFNLLHCYICMYIYHIHIYVYIYMCVCIYIYIYVYVYVGGLPYIYIYMYIYIYIYIHIKSETVLLGLIGWPLTFSWCRTNHKMTIMCVYIYIRIHIWHMCFSQALKISSTTRITPISW